MDPQILLFRRQYLQLFEPDFLAWPPTVLLKDVTVQTWLYENLFNDEKHPRLPSDRYQLRVLKTLVSRIEKAIEDPEADEISDSLMSRLSTLMATTLPSELLAAQQASYVTFSCIPPKIRYLSNMPDHYEAAEEGEGDGQEPTLTLLEHRNLISGSKTTGFRTWEAALHLGSFLLASAEIVRGKNVLELGVGTGFVSLLCAKYLHARHVTATDGDSGVIEAFKENLFLNGLDDVDDGVSGEERKVNASILRWGHGLKGTWVEDDCENWPYDVVLGADITYDKTSVSALAATLRFLFDLRPQLQVWIAGAVRNPETFETFRHACVRNGFHVVEVDFEAKPIHEQMGLFYATAVPLKILSITRELGHW